MTPSNVLGFLRAPTFGRTVLILLSVAFAALLVSSVTSFFMITRTAEFNRSADHSQEVRRNIREVQVFGAYAEGAQRGYLLTASPEYLVPLEEALREQPVRLTRLRILVADNPAQLALASEMDRISTARRDLIRQSVDFAKQGRIGEAMTIVRTGGGFQLTLQVRDLARRMDRAETLLQGQRAARAARANTLTVVFNGIGSTLIIAVAIACLLLFRRYIAEIQRSRDELDRINVGLEETVRARTADLVNANEEIQRFAYIVSHDLRAPLVNVMGYTSELEQAGKVIDRQLSRFETEMPDLIESDAVAAVREDVPEAIGFIRASTAKMDRLINAILRLSRDGRRTPTVETLNMTALLQGIADTIDHQVTSGGGQILVHDLPTLDSDRLAVEQIFGNLLDNAVKYLEPGRAALIEITGDGLPGGLVEYRVSDNGRGIAEKDFERVFELFRRSGRQDQPGEGLGLAFVRNSMRRLGGMIDVESELGKGSTFILKFPKRLALTLGADE